MWIWYPLILRPLLPIWLQCKFAKKPPREYPWFRCSYWNSSVDDIGVSVQCKRHSPWHLMLTNISVSELSWSYETLNRGLIALLPLCNRRYSVSKREQDPLLALGPLRISSIRLARTAISLLHVGDVVPPWAYLVTTLWCSNRWSMCPITNPRRDFRRLQTKCIQRGHEFLQT